MRNMRKKDRAIAEGLFMLAVKHREKYQEYEKLLHKHLGSEDGGHISDEIWESKPSLEDALAREFPASAKTTSTKEITNDTN